MIRNAIWNVVAGMSGAILTVALPPLLVRIMPVETFGAWVFCLQVAGYMNILGLGLQAVVSKMVAVANARNNIVERDEILSTAVLILLLTSLTGMLGMVLFSTQLNHFFPAAGDTLRVEMQYTLLLLSGSFAFLLPSTAINGLFIGLERNRYYAFPAILTKILTFVMVIQAWLSARTLTAMGLAWLIATATGSALLFASWFRHVPQRQLSFGLFSRTAAVELARDAMGLTVWNIAMILVSGVQLIIVARVAHQDVGIYAIASTLVLFIVGLTGAFAGAITPRAASLLAHQKYKSLADDARSMSLVVICIASASALLLGTWADWLLRIWGGKAFTETAPAILAILALAHCIRNLALVYVMIAVGGGLQSRMLITPMVEGLVSVTASVILGSHYGSIGVACGLLIASFLGIGLLAWQNILCGIARELDFFEIIKPVFLTAVVPAILTACIAVLNSKLNAQIVLMARLCGTICTIGLFVVAARALVARPRKRKFTDG